MVSFDVVIVGSGAAGVWAAEALRGRRVAIVDVGYEAPEPRLDTDSLYELRARSEDLAAELLGESYESLQNLYGPHLNPKLKGPALRFVTRDTERLAPMVSETFRAVSSFSRGGLANAWGAGAFHFDASDLAGFPIDVADLAPWFERLAPAIGLSGIDDDLSPWFGSAGGLDAPPRLDAQAELFLRRYVRQRTSLQARGIYVGRQRLAVATRDRPGRPGIRYAGLDFFEPERPAVYTPAATLEDLVRDGAVTYLPGRLAQRWEERDGEVRLHVEQLASGTSEEIRAKRLLLAAGALGSARLALASRGDTESRLPILDNPVSFMPLLAPERLGCPQETRFYGGGMVNLVYRGSAASEPVQGSFYGMSGVLRSDFAFELPLAAGTLPAAARWLAPALGMLQLFYADTPRAENRIHLEEGGRLRIDYRARARGAVERVLLRGLRRMGYFGALQLCQFPPPGSSIHYAGTLPMSARPSTRYETHPDGRLADSERVYVCDAATFPRLPAKNLTLSAMANSMRIASGMAAELA